MRNPPKSDLRLSWLRLACATGLVLAAGCANEVAVAPGAPREGVFCAPPAAWEGTRQGTHGYVEATAGGVAVVISVPHGGSMQPDEIPDRTRGEKTADAHTIDLGRAVVEAFREHTGREPYLVVCHLHRRKLDANRDVDEAAQGHADSVRAWSEYHAFVDEACADVVRRFGSGLYIDLHGHAHEIPRLELGYLLSARELDAQDTELAGWQAKSSLRALRSRAGVDFASLLRGPTSLGGLLSNTHACVPSPSSPTPGQDAYFNGGYSTRVHTRQLPGLQIEAPLRGVRDTPENRARFGRALVSAIDEFLRIHAGVHL